MALGIKNQSSLQLLNTLFGKKNKRRSFGFSTSSSMSAFTLSADAFSFASVNQVIKLTVEKMQGLINRSPTGAFNQLRSGAAIPLNELSQTIAEPTRQEVEAALAEAGGREALSGWIVDGKTKLNINGRKVVAQVDGDSSGSGQPATAGSGADLKNDLLASIGRFGLDAQSLDKGAANLRDTLKQAADRIARENPNLALAVEYALEDAYAKISAWEGGATGASASSYEQQRETNLRQAAEIASQLKLGDSDWGVKSLAEDLAVFGMDMTAMAKDPFSLAEEIRTKSKEMLADLEQRYVGTETEFIKERNRITGASARLVNGLEGSPATMALASMSLSGTFASSNVTVSVGGTSLDAAAIIAVGNVIVDPLVLDLNGDGIDLKGADEGVEFDMTGDGGKTDMGFIKGDDALLFLDLHGDGVVRDGRQLFGNNGGHANGFEALRQYDENGDGVIDENDSVYDQLMVWQEKTEDGVCEREETMTLREAGVKSINLGYQNVREDDGKGNLIGQTGSFTREDGSEGFAADVWFQEKKA